MIHERQNAILKFWFGEDPLRQLDQQKIWFAKDTKIDSLIKELFEPDLNQAALGAYDSWTKTPDGALALVLLCDQFPRNMYRGNESAFAFDPIALRAAQIAIDHQFDKKLTVIERCFLYLPFEHSEDVDQQSRSVEIFTELLHESNGREKVFVSEALDYAVRHCKIVQDFGRFPSRNEILGRPNTKAEAEFLKRPNAFF